MITAKNYAAQAEVGIRKYAEYLMYSNRPNDSVKAKFISNGINKAVKFSINDNGRILDDKLKGIRNIIPRMPFEICTIELSVTKTSTDDADKMDEKYGAKLAEKAVILVFDDPNSDYICAYPCLFINGKWLCCQAHFLMIKKGINIIDDDGFLCHIEPFFNDIKYSNNAIDFDKTTMTRFARVIFEFIEALSCKNVSYQNIQDAPPESVARSRAKAGKLPIYETKVLTINTSYQPSGKHRASTGTHASPRQHLRMGHIRRLESGNIWVNSCVVGDPNKGKIDKTYLVT